MFAKSIPGPKYSVLGFDCQDASDKKAYGGVKVIAVADGHGSGDCFRSEIGAAIAVKTALSLTEKYVKGIFDMSPTEFNEAGSANFQSEIRFSEAGIAVFKHEIWKTWRDAVKKDWETRLEESFELGEGEIRFAKVSDKYKARYMDKKEAQRYLYTAYGTTLLIAISLWSRLLVLQIGDGTCVVLRKDGEFCTPVPADKDNFLNVVVSLCEDGANLKFRHACIDCKPDSPNSPAAVFLSTDGLDNCYPIYENEQHLYRLYTVILDNILKEGFEPTEEEIAGDLLPSLTARGSKDDITLAYLVEDDLELLGKAYDFIEPCYKEEAEAGADDETIRHLDD